MFFFWNFIFNLFWIFKQIFYYFSKNSQHNFNKFFIKIKYSHLDKCNISKNDSKAISQRTFSALLSNLTPDKKAFFIWAWNQLRDENIHLRILKYTASLRQRRWNKKWCKKFRDGSNTPSSNLSWLVKP